MTKLRISIVQYLNTAPLVWGFTNGPLQGKYELSFTVPSQCAEELRTGAADIAIIPAIEYQRIADLVILPDISIASKKQVRSLLIVAKKPIERAKSFALDLSSRSTQALTRILCAEKWKTAPQFFEAPPDLGEMLQRADAALLIGDPALRVSLGIEKDSWPGAEGQTVCHAATLGIASSELLYVYDVVGEWRGLTGLPAVLAVWAARRDVATPEVTADFSPPATSGCRASRRSALMPRATSNCLRGRSSPTCGTISTSPLTQKTAAAWSCASIGPKNSASSRGRNHSSGLLTG